MALTKEIEMEEVARYCFRAVWLLFSIQFPLFRNKEKSPLTRAELCRQSRRKQTWRVEAVIFLVLFLKCPFELWPKQLLKQALHWLKHLKCFWIALFEPIKSFVYVLTKDTVKLSAKKDGLPCWVANSTYWWISLEIEKMDNFFQIVNNFPW